ncbi:uncharacterized protein LODBEIA_P10520 [Lodderomyces beijingensis]|uniref:histone acetyltransferase n=1 Tax=Lodderomyces beijingensis TaxID=1775926 RepID=A0ABP0ZGV1_9ASCO
MSLSSKLSDVLPRNSHFKYAYVQSRPVYVKSPINLKSNASNRPETVKIRHFFNLIQADMVILLGVEVYTYLQIYHSHVDQFIFVAKCDTTGLAKLPFKVARVAEVFLRYVMDFDISKYEIRERKQQPNQESCETNGTIALIHKLQAKLKRDPSHFYRLPHYSLINPQLKTQKRNQRKLPSRLNLRLCLFTKTAPQYLYPNSSRNKLKHLITGQALLQWWVKIVDKLTQTWPRRKLIIPGSDELATRKFLRQGWTQGWIFESLSDLESESDSAVAVFNVPVFPDDPKGRFLEHLIVEHRWQRVSTQEFYGELGYRSEFRRGDCVGLIGCAVDGIEQAVPSSSAAAAAAAVVSLRQYKMFLDLIKSVNFDVVVDVRHLVGVAIAELFKRCGVDFEYAEVIGRCDMDNSEKRGGNDSGGERKRVAPVANDLTGLIKRRKKK